MRAGNSMLRTLKTDGKPFDLRPVLFCSVIRGEAFGPKRADLDEVRLISPHP